MDLLLYHKESTRISCVLVNQLWFVVIVDFPGVNKYSHLEQFQATQGLTILCKILELCSYEWV